jgi:hypothetical protein
MSIKKFAIGSVPLAGVAMGDPGPNGGNGATPPGQGGVPGVLGLPPGQVTSGVAKLPGSPAKGPFGFNGHGDPMPPSTNPDIANGTFGHNPHDSF